MWEMNGKETAAEDKRHSLTEYLCMLIMQIFEEGNRNRIRAHLTHQTAIPHLQTQTGKTLSIFILHFPFSNLHI